MKNLGLPLLAVGGLCFAVLSLLRTHPTVLATTPPQMPPRSPYSDCISAVGLIEANSENISLGTHLSGVVEQVYVTAGQPVEKGGPLLKLDTRHLMAALSRAQADTAARAAEAETARSRVVVSEAQANEAQELLRIVREAGSRSVSSEEVTRRTHAAASAAALLNAARATVVAADAATQANVAAAAQIQTDIDRCTVGAPIAGMVLQVNVRAGEYVGAGVSSTPWMLLGNTEPLHVRVDVDESEAWRLTPEAQAQGQVRGNTDLGVQLKFVRFEPYVVPKRSLTGDATERVDTRVLQVIYAIERGRVPLFVGQQLDVFINAAVSAQAATQTGITR